MTRKMTKAEEKREYEEILNSFLNLKQGKAEAYSELVEQAMTATDNILKLKSACKKPNVKCRKPLNFENGDNEKRVKGKVDSKDENKNKALGLITALQSIAKDGKHLTGQTIESIIGEVDSLEGIHTRDYNTSRCDECEVQDGLKVDMTTKSEKTKKLISGKCTKPDEADIKQVVKFPHEKLDPRHTSVNDRQFDKLPFHLLIAGELEIVANSNVGIEEKFARVNIAKTVCYHKAYLNDSMLREGYDQILKSVEQGNNAWTDNLGEKLHDFYNYQANKLIREKVKQDGACNEKSSRNPNEKMNKPTNTENIIYCAAYN